MSLTIHWWPFHPYTIPSAGTGHQVNPDGMGGDQVSRIGGNQADEDALHGLLVDILARLLRNCLREPEVEVLTTRRMRYVTQHDFLPLLLDPEAEVTDARDVHVFLPDTLHAHDVETVDRMLGPETVFLPVLESPGKSEPRGALVGPGVNPGIRSGCRANLGDHGWIRGGSTGPGQIWCLGQRNLL